MPTGKSTMSTNFRVSMSRNSSFFSITVFFHEHSRFTDQQGKGEGIFLTPLYHLYPLQRHSDVNRTITAGSPPLLAAGLRPGTFRFAAQVGNH